MKKWLSLVTSVAVAFVMCLGCMGMFADKAFAADGDDPAVPEFADLIVEGPTGDCVNFYLDKANKQVYYFQDGVRKDIENVEVSLYTAVNKKGNSDNVDNAVGPKVIDIIEAAGIDYSKLGNEMIQVIPSDGPGKMLIFTWNDLFGKERYVFPNMDKSRAEGDNGAAAADEEFEGMEAVPVIINLNYKNQLSFGQVSPNERNKPGFSQNMLVKDKDNIPTIAISDTKAQACHSPAHPSADEVELGEEISLGEYDKNTYADGMGILYYTTDGSTPDQFSEIYNWLCNKEPYKYNNIVADKTGELTIKTRMFAYGWKKSTVETFTVDVTANLSKSGSVDMGGTAFAAGTKPAPTVTANGIKLDPSKDYKVIYSGNGKVGQAKVTVMGKGYVDGSKNATYTVIPAKAAISKVKAAKKKMTVTIADQKASGVTGYEIAYKQSKAKSWKTVKTTSTKKVIKKLKSKKKYNVKVRANGPTGYGEYSAVKTIKIK